MQRDEAFFKQTFTERVVQLILEIPYGKVTNYGTIALLAGFPRRSRLVGYILHGQTKKHDLPWHRIVNVKGYLSIRGEEIDAKNLQKVLLEQEGVPVSEDYVVDLDEYGWFGEER